MDNPPVPYFHWALADNFEWSEGFHRQFGLVHVDHDSQFRTPTRSYGWYPGPHRRAARVRSI